MFGFWKRASLEITTHPAIFDDLTYCAEIHGKCFSQNWDENELATLLNSKATNCIVANTSRSKGKPVGFLMYRISAGEAEILTIAVDPDNQGQGIGLSLLDELIRSSLVERLEEIFLEVDDSNLAALSIYKRRGFKKVGERKGYYETKDRNQGDVTSSKGNALIMRLDLSQ